MHGPRPPRLSRILCLSPFFVLPSHPLFFLSPLGHHRDGKKRRLVAKAGLFQAFDGGAMTCAATLFSPSSSYGAHLTATRELGSAASF